MMRIRVAIVIEISVVAMTTVRYGFGFRAAGSELRVE